MEAVLHKSKSKKQHKKYKQSSSTEKSLVKDETNCENFLKSDEEKFPEVNLKQPTSTLTTELEYVEKDSSCDNFIKNENIKLQKIDSEELVKSSVPIIHSSAPPLEELPTNVNIIHAENLTENEETEKKVFSEDNKIDSDKICDTVFKSLTEIPINQMNECSTHIAVKQGNELSSENTIVQKASLIIKEDLTKAHPLHLYPDLKHLQHCEKVHSILSSQTLVRTSADKFKTKTAVEANKCFQDFVKTLEDLDKHPLMDMIDQYKRAKKSSTNFRSRLKYLKSDLKRKKDSLWKTVKKEAFAKGKCDDGYTVNVKHTYTIKELDQDRFDEVKSILKEIEELLLSDAFHSYLEEVVQLRIDHYINEVIENEDKDPKIFGKGFSDELSARDSNYLKKSISVLFHSQRQNVQDSQYLNTCQNWLKTVASKMMQNGSFNDTLFVMNHIIRCPSGIANWASQFIQIPLCTSEAGSAEMFDSGSAQQILLALYLVLNPVPLKEFFLKSIKDSPLTDPVDKFAVLDSEGEEEEVFEMSKNLSDADVLSLLNQIPVRSLYKNFLLDDEARNDPDRLKIKILSDGELLKLFAYSTAIIDVLFSGLETYYSENFELFFENISNLIRHILLYISKYWTHHINVNNNFKSEIQAVYDKLFFHIVYKIYNFEKIHIWKILPALPYAHISEKMLWNILWIFFSPRKTEDQIYSEKDVEIKIKDDCIHTALINHIKELPVHDIYHLLNAIEKIIKSCCFTDKDFIKFSFYIIFKITVLEPFLCKILSNEGLIIVKDVAESFPILVSELLRIIDENYDSIPDSQQCLNLFMKMNILNWVPEDSDMCIISSWLMLNLYDWRKQLACLLLKNLNWDYKEDQLFLPYDLHKRVALTVAEAYVKFDSDNKNEGLVSKGVKQMLQFTSIGNQKEEEKFVHWAWNVLFSLKLHPLDRKNSPWIEIYDGYVEECKDMDFNSDIFQPLLLAYAKKHPCACYLMLIMSNEGRSLKGLLNGGLNCFSSLVDNEQYMAAINSLYYILPFFVKNSDELLENIEFVKALSNLITADLTVISNITRKPVIGAVLHKVASVIKHQFYQAAKSTVECAAPLLKLWIKILMKMMSPTDNNPSANLKNSAEQIHFLLDVCVKISFLHEYTRDSILDLFSSYCSPLSQPKAPQSSFWNRIFYSNSTEYPILNRSTIPEYPWLAWVVLFSEMKQKNIENLSVKISRELVKQSSNDSSAACLKKMSQTLKIDLEILPVYRWALQAVKTPISHPVLPLIWQQFFLYFFQKSPVSSSENLSVGKSAGLKFFRNGQYEWLLKKIKIHLADTENFYRNFCKTSEHGSSEIGLKNKENKSAYFNLADNIWYKHHKQNKATTVSVQKRQSTTSHYEKKVFLKTELPKKT